MAIAHLDEMSADALREAATAIAARWDAALLEYKQELERMPRRMNAAQRARIAYLHGVIAGAAKATREIEKRAPLKLVCSTSAHQ